MDIAEDGRHLAKHRGFLVVSSGKDELGRVPLDDLAAVIATSAATTASCALLAELAERGVPFVLCGRNYAPAGLVWPVAGHHAQQRRMEAQLERGRAMGKRLWADIVRMKIQRQGWVLMQIGQASGAFARLARLVRAGDPDNLEAQAARRYWPLLLGADFRRDTDADGANALLNYGYAVLRAATARAIAAAGLHPGLGIFHRHPFNTMPLADDLMEPFRPLVDLRVKLLLGRGVQEVSADAKRELAAVLLSEERTVLGSTPLSTCLIRLASSLAESFVEGVPGLEFPLLEAEQMGSDEYEEDA
ncbi:MAG: type II CRISPR-associated endonuclease Cas1 [Alphaproteobacteria bacterium]|nr:type II CRISPR-associated endonuclease Cas1 [Alphaproteobacteria bacterium]